MPGCVDLLGMIKHSIMVQKKKKKNYSHSTNLIFIISITLCERVIMVKKGEVGEKDFLCSPLNQE
jgi:hypothetical protein